ncbi:MAG: HlyD family efflux transporter periplasmic adaptor subunit [Legionella sp.]|nr:HlyD family efflux transporter periplasmic adaptor subunit [Legionella sp.]
MKLRWIFFFIVIFITSCDKSDKPQFQGYIEGENIYLASPNSGRLIYLPVDRGDSVKKGQLLFKLDKEPQSLFVKEYEEKLDEAKHLLKDLINPKRAPEILAIKAQIEQADADMQLAEIRVNRYRELYKKNAVDKDSLDVAIANLTRQQKLKAQYAANLELAQLGGREEKIKAQQEQISALSAQYHEAQWQLAQKEIHAPASGVVFDTYYHEGEFVGSEKAVLAILTPANIKVEFYVPVQTLASIKIGQKIAINCYGCTNTTEATISYISPEAQYIPPLVYSRENNDKLVFRIKASLPDFNQYKPGQPVTVYLK